MMNTSPTESCRECNSLNWKLDSVKGEWVCPDCGETKQNLTSDEDSNQGSLHGENSQYQEVGRGASAGGTLPNLRSKKFTKDASGTSANAKFVRTMKRADRIAYRTDPARKKARKDAETKKFIENLLRDIRPDSNENRRLLQAILKDRRIFVVYKNRQRRQTDSGVRIKNDDAHIIAWTEIYVYISNPNSNVVIAIKTTPDGRYHRFKDEAGPLSIPQITKNRSSNHERRCRSLKSEINREISEILQFLKVALNPSNQLNLGLFRLRHYRRIEESEDFLASICNILKSDRNRLISDVEFKSKVTTFEDDKFNQVISTLENPGNTEKFNLIVEVLRINKPIRIIDHLLYHIYGSKLIRRSDLEKVLGRTLQAKKHKEIIAKFSSLEGFPSDKYKGQ